LLRSSEAGIDLPRVDGSTTHLPSVRHEVQTKERKVVCYTTDFRRVLHCERCGGNHSRETGELLDGSGILTVGLRRKRDDDGNWRDVTAGERWVTAAAACDCVYGAWRHAVQDMPWADRLVGVPSWLTSRHWMLLVQAHQAGDTYTAAAERVTGESGWEDVLGRIADVEGVAVGDDLPF
jgi:hypothetical protein